MPMLVPLLDRMCSYFFVYEIMLQFLFLAICLGLLVRNILLLAICMDYLFILICMTSFISIPLVLFYLLFK
jgi:hypothetical protein